MDSLGDSEVSVETVAQEGDSADAIIKVAEDRGADLMVVGSIGITGVKRFRWGTVTSRVSHHAPRSVYVARIH